MDAQEVSFNQSSSITQTIMDECFSVSNTCDRYTDSNNYFFLCEIQEPAAASSLITRLYADMNVSTSVYS